MVCPRSACRSVLTLRYAATFTETPFYLLCHSYCDYRGRWPGRRPNVKALRTPISVPAPRFPSLPVVGPSPANGTRMRERCCGDRLRPVRRRGRL